jgi:hypothetical protein
MSLKGIKVDMKKRITKEIKVINDEQAMHILEYELSPEKHCLKCEYKGFMFDITYYEGYPFTHPDIKVFKDDVQIGTTIEECMKEKCLCCECLWGCKLLWSPALTTEKCIKIIYEDILNK